VTLTGTTCRDPTCTITTAYSVWKNIVTTGTKSQAQMSWPCVFKNVDQDCPDGGQERTARMYFWIVRFATRTPNFSSSPRIRSAPHSGFSRARRWMGAIVSALKRFGGFGPRDLNRHKRR